MDSIQLLNRREFQIKQMSRKNRSILSLAWLGIRFEEREPPNDSLDKSKITKIRGLFKE